MIDIQRRNKAIRKCFYEQLGKGMPVGDEAMAIGYGTPYGLLDIGRFAMGRRRVAR